MRHKQGARQTKDCVRKQNLIGQHINSSLFHLSFFFKEGKRVHEKNCGVFFLNKVGGGGKNNLDYIGISVVTGGRLWKVSSLLWLFKRCGS